MNKGTITVVLGNGIKAYDNEGFLIFPTNEKEEINKHNGGGYMKKETAGFMIGLVSTVTAVVGLVSVFIGKGGNTDSIGTLGSEWAGKHKGRHCGGRVDANGWHTAGGKGSGNPPHWHPRPGQTSPGEPFI